MIIKSRNYPHPRASAMLISCSEIKMIVQKVVSICKFDESITMRNTDTVPALRKPPA